jgi:hypothetical protein
LLALARIFSVLAVLAVLLLAANFVAGLWIGDFNAAAQAKRVAAGKLSFETNKLRLERERTSPAYEQARREFAAADKQFGPPRARMTLHLLLGSAAALVAILVNSITITYFVGTSRWCKEVCETYRLSGDLAAESARIKRSAFPWAVLGVLTVIGIVAFGAAADASGANHIRSAAFVMPHYIVAMAGLAIITLSFWIQVQRIAENYAVIAQILAEVKRMREK